MGMMYVSVQPFDREGFMKPISMWVLGAVSLMTLALAGGVVAQEQIGGALASGGLTRPPVISGPPQGYQGGTPSLTPSLPAASGAPAVSGVTNAQSESPQSTTTPAAEPARQEPLPQAMPQTAAPEPKANGIPVWGVAMIALAALVLGWILSQRSRRP